VDKTQKIVVVRRIEPVCSGGSNQWVGRAGAPERHGHRRHGIGQFERMWQGRSGISTSPWSLGKPTGQQSLQRFGQGVGIAGGKNP
jgi:hypothetical protein